MNTDMKKPTGGGNPTAGNTDEAIVAREHAAAALTDKEFASRQAASAIRGHTLHRQVAGSSGCLYAVRSSNVQVLSTPYEARLFLAHFGGTP